MKCILLDDEIPGLTLMRTLCSEIKELEIVKAYSDAEKFLSEQNQLNYDLLILDIEMPGITGLQVAEQVQGKAIIFVTAYKEYGPEAFNVDAVDYLCKPVSRDRLIKSIAKAAKRIKTIIPEKKYFQFNTELGKSLIYFDTIFWISLSEVDKRDKVIHFEDGKQVLIKNITFDKLLEILPKGKFVRINRKELLAVKTVKHYLQESITTEINGAKREFTLSESYRSQFLALI